MFKIQLSMILHPPFKKSGPVRSNPGTRHRVFPVTRPCLESDIGPTVFINFQIVFSYFKP